MSDVPENAPEHCPGTGSEEAGKASACQGCPNQTTCSSVPKGPDPAIAEVKQKLASVKHKIIVLSGKGGVGKSTFTAHLAHGLASDPDKQVAVLDVDICGPSMPKILGVEGEQVHNSGSGWSPVFVTDNLAVMSIGFLLPSLDDAVIWRGPKKNGLIKQFLKDTDWGEVDFLVIDTPPGTSDEHLSIAQYLSEANVDGAVVITTPQEISLLDVRKIIRFCEKVKLPVIGLVENMSGFVCPKCKTESQIFPPTTGGGKKLSEDAKVPLLGQVPLDPRIGKCCDEGKSYLTEVPDSPATHALAGIINTNTVDPDGNSAWDVDPNCLTLFVLSQKIWKNKGALCYKGCQHRGRYWGGHGSDITENLGPIYDTVQGLKGHIVLDCIVDTVQDLKGHIVLGCKGDIVQDLKGHIVLGCKGDIVQDLKGHIVLGCKGDIVQDLKGHKVPGPIDDTVQDLKGHKVLGLIDDTVQDLKEHKVPGPIDNTVQDLKEHKVSGPIDNTVQDLKGHKVLGPIDNTVEDLKEHKVPGPIDNTVQDLKEHKVPGPIDNTVQDLKGHKVLGPIDNTVEDLKEHKVPGPIDNTVQDLKEHKVPGPIDNTVQDLKEHKVLGPIDNTVLDLMGHIVFGPIDDTVQDSKGHIVLDEKAHTGSN